MKSKIKEAPDSDVMNFSDIAESLYNYIKLTWDVDVKPKGYKEFIETYDEGKGMGDQDNKKIVEDFTGLDDATASSPSFPFKLEIANVAYDDNEQGRDPLEVLIGAILSHGILIGTEQAKRNTRDNMGLNLSINRLKDIVKDLEYFSK